MVFFSKKWSRRTRLRRIGHRHDRGKQSVEMRIEVDREQPIRKKQSTSGTASFSKRHRFEVTVSFFSLHLSIDVRNSETGEGLRVSVQCMNVCSRLSSKVFFSPPPPMSSRSVTFVTPTPPLSSSVRLTTILLSFCLLLKSAAESTTSSSLASHRCPTPRPVTDAMEIRVKTTWESHHLDSFLFPFFFSTSQPA